MSEKLSFIELIHRYYEFQRYSGSDYLPADPANREELFTE
jgi:hypothetical protein